MLLVFIKYKSHSVGKSTFNAFQLMYSLDNMAVRNVFLEMLIINGLKFFCIVYCLYFALLYLSGLTWVNMNQQSRFFATVSDSDSESSSSEEEQKEVKALGGGTYVYLWINPAISPSLSCCFDAIFPCLFLSNFQFSDDEEDTKRVVRSSKEKRY